MEQSAFGDRERMADALAAQKAVTDSYNTAANECASIALKNEMLNLLNEEHKLQHDVFEQMQKRGWYPTQAAEQKKIDAVKQQYGTTL